MKTHIEAFSASSRGIQAAVEEIQRFQAEGDWEIRSVTFADSGAGSKFLVVVFEIPSDAELELLRLKLMEAS